MKGTAIILAMALISTIAHSNILFDRYDPILTVRQSSEPHHQDAKGQIPVVFQYGTISVPKELWFLGLHGLAYKQLTYLYPTYRTLLVKSCIYTVYGPSRIYAYELLDGLGGSFKLFSSVQNNQQASGQQTQQAVEQQAKAEINAKQANKKQETNNEHSDFNVIKLSRAYEIPRIAVAIKSITRTHWKQIRSAPLVRCLERWERGTYRFRLFFNGIQNWFQYIHLGEYHSQSDEMQKQKSNLRAEVISDFYDSQVIAPKKQQQGQVIAPKKQQQSKTLAVNNEEYLPRQQPIFSVKAVDSYDFYSLASFKKHPGYQKVIQRINSHFGSFDEQWISKIQYKVDSNVHYFQLQVKFIPFLVDVDLEAHYYGSTQKASILQIDQKVFNGDNNQQYFNSWNEIKEFSSYKSFREANEYVLSQFTYLRFYKVTAAYSALHKNGRYVRLVYQSENNFFSAKGENQFNILVYICDGKFYIDREDFHATSTYSFGKNDWLSFFVKVEDVNTHEAYHRIVKFFMTDHLQFWHAHRLEQLRFKDGLHVVKFRNPSAAIPADQQEKECVLNVTTLEVKVLNHFDWKRVDEKAIHHTKAIAYIRQKYPDCTPMFIRTIISPYGRHFQVSYLNSKKAFSNAYLRYVDAEDLITQDQWQGIAYSIDFDQVPLPVDSQERLTKWVIQNHNDVIAIVELKASSKNTFQCVALTDAHRWRINVNWAKGQWVVNSKQLINDGYFFLSGYPSVSVASCTGYLARLYPTSFSSQWLYSAIQVKNIGYFVYTRVIYNLGVYSYQGIVRTTHGVENSHSLISWDRIRHMREKTDYGYGVNYDWSYGFNSRYFFDYVSQPFIVQVPTAVISSVQIQHQVIDKTDLLCSYWDDDRCISCYGDYFADNNGGCIRVQDQCEFWKVSGVCERCSYGWSVDSQGKCIAAVTVPRY